ARDGDGVDGAVEAARLEARAEGVPARAVPPGDAVGVGVAGVFEVAAGVDVAVGSGGDGADVAAARAAVDAHAERGPGGRARVEAGDVVDPDPGLRVEVAGHVEGVVEGQDDVRLGRAGAQAVDVACQDGRPGAAVPAGEVVGLFAVGVAE